MSYQLRKPLAPEDGESLAGLIARNAAVFHFQDPKRVLHQIQPPRTVLWTLCEAEPDGEFGTRLRKLLGIEDPAAFRRMSPWTGDPVTYSVMGHPVWRELVQPEARAFCPLCLAEKVYHRAVWSIRAMPVCAVHGVWLSNRCPVCNKPLSWFGARLHLCSRLACRADLRRAPAEYAPDGVLPAMLALHRLAHTNGGVENGFLQLGFAETLKLSFLLGQIHFGFERASRPPGFMQRHGPCVPEIVAQGWEALEDWPHGFHRLLDGLRERAGERQGRGGLKKAFGTLAAKVYQWAREPWGTPIGQAFANYVASQGDLATTAHTIRRYAPGAEIRHMFITTAEAQRALGTSASTILRLARRRGLYELAPQGAGVPSLIRADVFRQIADEAHDFMLPDEARRELGVGRKVMDQLEADGLIKRLPISELVLESKPFRRTDIIAFVSACTAHAVKLTKDDAGWRKLSTIVSATAPGRTVPDICRALVDGRLRPAACVPREKGLLKARLVLADVERVLPSTKETLSLLDAAKQIGLKWGSVRHWVQRGLLETTRSEGVDERGLRVSREAWDRFLSEYVTSKMLARELGQKSNTWVSRHLVFLGIHPVSGEDVDGGPTMLFRRLDVGPDVLKAIRRIQKGSPGSPQEKHRRSFARVKLVAAALQAEWGTTFTRDHNLFTDGITGTALQVVSGRRPDLTGVFSFHARPGTLQTLNQHQNPWVALVPNEGDRFLLVPADRVPWRGGDLETRFVSLRFDGLGRPLDLVEWERAIPVDKPLPKARKVKKTRRAFDIVVQVATEIERHWGTELDRNRNAFGDPVTGRRLHVVCGRPCGGPTQQVFNIRRESFDRLGQVDGWVALVPDGGSAFLLARVGEIDWRGEGGAFHHTRVRFDVRGLQMELGLDGNAQVLPLHTGGHDDE